MSTSQIIDTLHHSLVLVRNEGYMRRVILGVSNEAPLRERNAVEECLEICYRHLRAQMALYRRGVSSNSGSERIKKLTQRA
jgi:hypothetical protein